MTKFPAVVVVWDDIISYKGGGWSQVPHSGPPSTFRTAGWVTDETDTYYTIHSSLSDQGLYGHDTVIPKGVIRQIIFLEEDLDVDPEATLQYATELEETIA